MTTFISLAISDTMFPDEASMSKVSIDAERVKKIIDNKSVVSALNPSHLSTIDVIKRRFDIDLPLPVLAPGEIAPKVALQSGDQLLVLQAQLPRLAEGEKRHSMDTVEKAAIKFSLWKVQ
jgi:hypothetical protein